jgi:hypothetical protein
MNKFRFTIKVLVIATFLIAFASIAQAQATRTWVSGVGDDVNPCSRTAPCKTFAGAISKTAAGGEIDALDPGGFGAVTITKSITLDGGTGSGWASILHSGTNGVNINDSATASPNSIKVTLRNLSIQGAGTTLGLNGINFTSGKDLIVENVSIENTSTNGILVNANSTVIVQVKISNCDIRRITGDGINLTNANASGQVKATVEHTSVTHSGNGLHARSNSRVTARNCVFSLNTTNGVFVDAVSSGFASAIIWNSQISLNGGNGIRAGNAGNIGSSGVEIALNQINRNVGNGVLISTNGAVDTFGNNSIRANGTDGCVGCTPVGPGS